MTAIFIVSAPSGSGKSTLVRKLLEKDPGLVFSISYTTRKPRGKEVDGESYHFIARDEFERMMERDEFLECAEVFGNYYGTHQSYYEEAQRTGKDLLLDIDVQGARQLKERLPEAVSIFILPPSRKVLEDRLRSRSEDSEEVIERRLRGAAGEIGNYRLYDYILVNQDLEESSGGLAGIVQAERLKRIRSEDRIRPILDSFGAVMEAATQGE